jgi:hypothetical protein
MGRQIHHLPARVCTLDKQFGDWKSLSSLALIQHLQLRKRRASERADGFLLEA